VGQPGGLESAEAVLYPAAPALTQFQPAECPGTTPKESVLNALSMTTKAGSAHAV